MYSRIPNGPEHLQQGWKIKSPRKLRRTGSKMIALSDQLAKEYASRFEGQVLEVIPEEPYKEDPESGLYEGHTDNYLKVVFPATEDMLGKIVG